MFSNLDCSLIFIIKKSSYILFSINHHNLTRYRNTYIQYIQYTIACYTKYVSNEESYTDQQFIKPEYIQFYLCD